MSRLVQKLLNLITTQTHLGRAYETWWSLSRVGPDSEGDRAKYVAGADTARIRALAAYREIVARLPGTAAARDAAEQIPRSNLFLRYRHPKGLVSVTLSRRSDAYG